MPQTALNYLWAFRNETQNKIASPIQYGKNKFIQFYILLSFKPEVFCVIFFIKVGISFKDFFILGKMGRASQKILVDKGSYRWDERKDETRKEESLTPNCSTIWYGTEKDRSHGRKGDHAILPQISLRKYAEANEGSGWCPRWSHKILNLFLICISLICWIN